MGKNCSRYQRKTGKNYNKNAQKYVKTHCRQWVCGHCDWLSISFFFRLTTFDVRMRRQKSTNSENRVFHISLKKGYMGKAIFSRLFSARYHILKKKTMLGLCRCSVDNYSHSWRPALSVRAAQAHMYDGGHLLSAVSMTARIFSALATWKQCCFSASH